MKKVIIYSVAILSVFLTISCTADEISENEIPVPQANVLQTGEINTTPPKK